MGPDGIVSSMIKLVTGKLKSAADALLPNLQRFETFLASSIDSTCQVATKAIVGYANGMQMPASFCTSTPPQSILDGNTAAITALLTTALSWAADEISALMNDKIWFPLIEMLTRLAISAQDAVAQIAVGLCGLIPEAGGPICMAITTPLTTLVGQLVSQLSSTSVRGLIDVANKAFQDQIVPPLAGKGAAMLAGVVQSIKDKVEPKMDAVDHAVESGVGVLQPVLDVAAPVLSVAVKSFLPKVADAVVNCDAMLDGVAQVVRAKMCLAKA